MKVLFFALALAIMPSITNAQTSPTPTTSYLLSIWSGSGYIQTHAVAVFEGERARERCEAAARAMRRYDARFNTGYTTCIPFVSQ